MSEAAPSTAVRIESLDQEGRGVARVAGKAVFVYWPLDKMGRLH